MKRPLTQARLRAPTRRRGGKSFPNLGKKKKKHREGERRQTSYGWLWGKEGSEKKFPSQSFGWKLPRKTAAKDHIKRNNEGRELRTGKTGKTAIISPPGYNEKKIQADE